ncbi:IS4 family transposase, partial [Pontibacter pamirensis]|uniref:IS4 family transposase n=1 Tax=Pontibacter pamirensis TaxID=2562824 RepID=UPI00138A4E8C
MSGDIFSDRRISRRVEDLATRILEKESVVIHRLANNEAQQRGFYRLLHNPNLKTGQVVEFIRRDCARQVEAGAHYLVFQDTTQPNFERNRGNISDGRELGVIGDRASLGFFLHPSLVVGASDGHCLGYSHVKTWSRDMAAQDKSERFYKKQPIEEKESYRWIEAAESSNALLEKAGRVTHVCDREGDISELFLRVPDGEKTHLLVRSSADRLLAGGGKLSTALADLPEAGIHRLTLKGDVRTGRQQREAELQVRHSKVRLRLGQREKELYVVEAKEANTPQGQKPVYWRLLTTHAVESLEQALQVLCWYSMRWNIEQVFRLLKHKGLDVEALQVETGKGLVQLSLLGLFAVSKIIRLHLAAKQQEPVEIAGAFTEEELRCMQALNRRHEGRTAKQRNPYSPDSLQWCYWVMARLGGWKPHEKRAGVITLHRGYMEFCKIFDGWMLA